MLQRFISRDALRRVKFEATFHELNSLQFLFAQTNAILFVPARAPQENLLPSMTGVADGRDVGLQHLAMQKRGFLHSLLAKDGAQFDKRVNVVGRVKEWETLAEECQKDDTTAPDIDQA